MEELFYTQPDNVHWKLDDWSSIQNVVGSDQENDSPNQDLAAMFQAQGSHCEVCVYIPHRHKLYTQTPFHGLM